MPLGIFGTFNFVIAFQAERNILMHPFHMSGVAGVFGGSLFSAMRGLLVTSSLIRVVQAEADARERHWQAQVQGLQGKVEKLESLLQREMGHHSPTPRPVYDISPVNAGQDPIQLALCSAV